MPGAITFVVFALAVARITRMINRDQVFAAPRRRLYRHLPHVHLGVRSECDRCHRPIGNKVHVSEDSLGAYLVLCPWCVSVYLGAIGAVVYWLWGTSPWIFLPALALAFSYVTGFLAEHSEG
jgi:hypothetical protein